MNINSVIVAVLDGKEVVVTKDLSAAKSGVPVRIQAQQGVKYLLAEGDNGLAPEKLTVKRVGNNLHVALEGTDPDDPQLIIEDYYIYEGQLIGMSEDSTYHEYVAINDESDNFIPFLMDGSSSVQALGVAELEGFTDGLALVSGGVIPTYVFGLGALGLLGGAVAVEDQRDDGGHKRRPAEAAETTELGKPSLDLVTDNFGKYQGKISFSGVTDDSTPTFSGKAEPHTTIHIYDGDQLIGHSVVDSNGDWTFTPISPLHDGKHKISVINENGAGVLSPPSDYFDFFVDTTPPENKGIESVRDGNESIGLGGLTSSNTPEFSGEGEPGSIVSVLENGSVIGEVRVDDNGRWSFIPDIELTEGSHSITVVHTDAAGNSSKPSLGYEITVDTISPERPLITEVIDSQGRVTGALQSGDSTDDTMPAISGEAEASCIVVIYSNNIEIARVLADENGRWSFMPNQPMDLGEYALTVKAIDAAGNSSAMSEKFEFTLVAEAVLPVPTIDLVYDDIGPSTGYIQSGDITDDAKPKLFGTSEVGTTVIILNYGIELGRVSVGDSGTWEFLPNTPLLNGEYELSVMAVNDAGDYSEASSHFMLTVQVGGVPADTAINTIKDDVGAHQGGLQKGEVTDDARPTIEGTAIPGYIVDVYDNGRLLGKTVSNERGYWRFTPDTDLSEGVHDFFAESYDGNGGLASKTGIFSIEVDTIAPNPPEISIVLDDVGAQQEIHAGGITDDRMPIFMGTTEPYAFIQLVEGKSVLGTAYADSFGKWELLPDNPLSDGLHSITVVATDEGGNKSQPSAAFEFTVNAVGHAAAIFVEENDTAAHEAAYIGLSLHDLLSDSSSELFGEVSVLDLEFSKAPVLDIAGLVDFADYSIADALCSASYADVGSRLVAPEEDVLLNVASY